MMIYTGDEMEKKAVLETASRMCAAARTAPKTRHIDGIHTLVREFDTCKRKKVPRSQ
jgi:uncharacterized ferredoxin-like protein